MPRPYFEIEEVTNGSALRLRLLGELDLGTAPVLEERLNELRTQKRAVRLDLSTLEFIDSTGIGLLLQAVGRARQDGWQLAVDERFAPQVKRVLELVHTDRFLASDARMSRRPAQVV